MSTLGFFKIIIFSKSHFKQAVEPLSFINQKWKHDKVWYIAVGKCKYTIPLVFALDVCIMHGGVVWRVWNVPFGFPFKIRKKK